jgi:hypothetical protein
LKQNTVKGDVVNKRYIGPIIFIAIITSTALLTISYSIAPRDISWISKVENWIKEENWEPDVQYEPISYASFFLYENGEEQFFGLTSQKEFASYMDGLLGSFVTKTRNSISKESVDEILAVDKVLSYVHRFPASFGPLGLSGSFEVAYFILEDKLGEELEGKIVMQDRRTGEYSHYSVWQITDWGLW